jgi:cytochrome c peroxidase
VVEIKTPLGLPPVAFPEDNPPTAETIALGRDLFHDPVLSKNRTVACVTCHDPAQGFSDGRPFSIGTGGQPGVRNSPTALNAAYSTVFFWDGRAATLEAQAVGPIMNPVEMAHSIEGVESAVSAAYSARFKQAFGSGKVTVERIAKALAAFERTLVSGNSPFDRYMYAGDRSALSESAARGLEIFRDAKKGNCAKCHSIGDKAALFTDNQFHNLGVGVDPRGELTDLGRYQVTKEESDKGAFKTPTLRNIALTAPYMHDGSLKTLKEVIDFYVGGGTANPYRDKDMKSLDYLTAQDRADLVAFLQSLTGEPPIANSVMK